MKRIYEDFLNEEENFDTSSEKGKNLKVKIPLNPSLEEIEEKINSAKKTFAKVVNTSSISNTSNLEENSNNQQENELNYYSLKKGTNLNFSQNKNFETFNYQPELNQSKEELENLKYQDFLTYAYKLKILKPKKSRWEPDPFPIKLATLNKVIPSKFLSPNNELFFKRIGTKEESLFALFRKEKLETLEDLDRAINKVMSLIIESCLVTNIPYNEISLLDKLLIFINIIINSYKSKINVRHFCDSCGEISFVQLDLKEDLKINYLPEDYKYPIEYNLTSFLPQQNIVIVFHLPKIKHEFLLFEETTIEKIIFTLTEVILELKDNEKFVPINKNEYLEIINNLNSEDRNNIRNFLKEGSKYGLNLSYNNFICSNNSCEKFNIPVKVDLFALNIISGIFEEILKDSLKIDI